MQLAIPHDSGQAPIPCQTKASHCCPYLENLRRLRSKTRCSITCLSQNTKYKGTMSSYPPAPRIRQHVRIGRPHPDRRSEEPRCPPCRAGPTTTATRLASTSRAAMIDNERLLWPADLRGGPASPETKRNLLTLPGPSSCVGSRQSEDMGELPPTQAISSSRIKTLQFPVRVAH